MKNEARRIPPDATKAAGSGRPAAPMIARFEGAGGAVELTPNQVHVSVRLVDAWAPELWNWQTRVTYRIQSTTVDDLSRGNAGSFPETLENSVPCYIRAAEGEFDTSSICAVVLKLDSDITVWCSPLVSTLP